MISDVITIVNSVCPALGLSFFHGTVKEVNKQLELICNSDGTIDNNVPFVFLVEVMSTERVLDKKSTLKERADCRLFVLDSCNYEDWLTATHYTSVVVPMEVKTDALFAALKAHRHVAGEQFTNARIWNHVNAGQYDDKGHTKNIFDFNFSGTEARFTLPILKTCNCC